MNHLVRILFWRCESGSLRDRALGVAYNHGPSSFRIAVLRLAEKRSAALPSDEQFEIIWQLVRRNYP